MAYLIKPVKGGHSFLIPVFWEKFKDFLFLVLEPGIHQKALRTFWLFTWWNCGVEGLTGDRIQRDTELNKITNGYLRCTAFATSEFTFLQASESVSCLGHIVYQWSNKYRCREVSQDGAMVLGWLSSLFNYRTHRFVLLLCLLSMSSGASWRSKPCLLSPFDALQMRRISLLKSLLNNAVCLLSTISVQHFLRSTLAEHKASCCGFS